MKFKSVVQLIVSIAICEGAGIIGAFFTAPAMGVWYVALQKPALNPPSWVFGPVWTTLYALMGIAAWLVWRRMDSGAGTRGNGILKLFGTSASSAQAKLRARQVQDDKQKVTRRKVRGALTIFGVQLLLNAIWSPIFFGAHDLGLALADLVLLWLTIVATMFVFAKLSKPAVWLLVPYILWVSFAGYLNYSLWRLNPTEAVRPVACTAEAKVCPNGSTVGRTGPQCEFTACPEPVVDPSWKTETDAKTGISFRYPATLGTTYMHEIDWPPKVAVTNGPFTCVAAGSEIERAGRTDLWKIDDRSYCVTRESEGAAGSIYTNYAYAVARGPQVWIFTATVRAVQCMNYDKPKQTDCQAERDSFDFDTVMDRIIQTATMR